VSAILKNIKVSGVGCCLLDYLHNNISFASEAFGDYVSVKDGDGGLIPGKLVFANEFEKFSKQGFDAVIRKITGGKVADNTNVGGPAIVALLHVAQLLEGTGCTVRFYGGRGDDPAGEYLYKILKGTPLNIDNYRLLSGSTPSTVVLSDPDFNNGTGERIFINTIGAAENYSPVYLDSNFFSSDIVVFGATALVPAIHDSLTDLLIKARLNGCVTVVNTVYDFRNQKANPDKKWPLGKDDRSYANIDLLVTNHEEAQRLSGQKTLAKAMETFRSLGTGAVVVTNGVENITLFAQENSIFQKVELNEMPVSDAIFKELKEGYPGDTTGCGDNFAGGLILSIVKQLQKEVSKLDLTEACTWAIVSGGFSCFYLGGTYYQERSGEKLEQIIPYHKKYLKQIAHD